MIKMKKKLTIKQAKVLLETIEKKARNRMLKDYDPEDYLSFIEKSYRYYLRDFFKHKKKSDKYCIIEW